MPPTRKAKKSSASKKVYITADNGGEPFRIEDDGKSVVVYRQKYDESANKFIVDKEVFHSSYKKIFVGSDPYKFSPVWEPWMKGNSVLLHINGLNYVFIGHNITSFKIAPEDEEVTKYISYMGNNGVPYPYAITKKHTYLIGLDKNDNMKIENRVLNLKKDVWWQYIQWTIRPPSSIWTSMSAEEKKEIESAIHKYSFKIIVKREY